MKEIELLGYILSRLTNCGVSGRLGAPGPLVAPLSRPQVDGLRHLVLDPGVGNICHVWESAVHL